MNDSSYKPFEDKMSKAIENLKNNFNTIRAGRANPRVLDRITVDYYGTPTPINQIANIQVADARLITVSPYDPSVLKDLERAIQASDLGINPMNDGKIIRLAFPPLTEDRRKELTRTVSKYGEESKIAVRNVRREAIDHFKNLEKQKEISEDELKDHETGVQKLTDRFVENVDKLVEEKSAELLEV